MSSLSKKGARTWKTYIYRVLKQIHPDTGISYKALAQMNMFMGYIAHLVADKARKLTIGEGKKTVTSREIQTVIRLILPGELVKHAVSEGTRAVSKYNSRSVGYTGSGSKKSVSRSARAGLQFTPSYAEKYIRNFGESSLSVGCVAPIYLAAALEYITAEMLELAGHAARDCKRRRITIRHITLVVENDNELRELCRNFSFLGGGVVGNIHSKFLPDKKKMGKNSAERRRAHKNDDKDGKKVHRFLPGTVAIREIRKYQRSIELLLQKAPFKRVVLDIIKEQDYENIIRIGAGALGLIQCYTEQETVKYLEKAALAIIHGDRETLEPKDLVLIGKMMGQPVVHNVPDTYINMTRPGLVRLCRRAGIKRVSVLAHGEIRSVIVNIATRIINASVILCNHHRTHTITTNILYRGAMAIGLNIAIYMPKSAKKSAKEVVKGDDHE